MTTNQFDDNVELWAGQLNRLVNAHDAENVLNGTSVTKGTGDWDADVAAGQVQVADLVPDVSAATLNITDPASDADMDANESRIDLITVNSTGGANIQEGTAASDPTSPDIPTDEVLVATIHVEESDSTLADSDINDDRSLSPMYPASLTDDGSDITEYTGDDDGASNAFDLVNVNDRGAFLGGTVVTAATPTITYTVDGGTDFNVTVTETGATNVAYLPPVWFTTSLKIHVAGAADTAGSGWIRQ